MRADAILTRKPLPPLEIECREAPTAQTTRINGALRGIFPAAMSLTGSAPRVLGEGWVALGLVQSRA